MAKRIISGVVIALILAAVLFFMFTPVLPVFISLVCAGGVYELNKVVKVKTPAMVLSVIMAAFLPIWIYTKDILYFPLFSGYIILMLIMMVKWHGELKFEQVAVSVFSSIALPFSLSCWINIALDHASAKGVAYYLILTVFSCSWLSDVFAYFCGRFFGKHKMTPIVSPKKTWEGAIGGVLLTAAVNVGAFLVFRKYFFHGQFRYWNIYLVVPISIVLSVISIFGDLSASVIKRNAGVKDYSNLIPGHGGIMDRFDSTLFVFPAMYAVLTACVYVWHRFFGLWIV